MDLAAQTGGNIATTVRDEVFETPNVRAHTAPAPV